MDSILAGVVTIDANTHEILDINPFGAEVIGLPREEIIGKTCHEFICPAETGHCPVTDLDQEVDKSERVLINAKGEKIPIIKSVGKVPFRGSLHLVEVFSDISDQIKAKKDMEKALEIKTKFTAMAAHEIRNPLTAIKGYADIMFDGLAGDITDTQKKY